MLHNYIHHYSAKISIKENECQIVIKYTHHVVKLEIKGHHSRTAGSAELFFFNLAKIITGILKFEKNCKINVRNIESINSQN